MKHSFYSLVAYTALVLLAASVTAACLGPAFGKQDVQVVCRAFPSQYGAWQYAPAGQLDSEHRWVKDCGEAVLFFKAYNAIWEEYRTDSAQWCVVCDQLPPCPGDFRSCP